MSESDIGAPPKRDIRLLRRLGVFLRPYRAHVVGALVALTVAAATVLAVGEGIRRLVDDGFAAGNAELLNDALLVLLVFIIFLACATYVKAATPSEDLRLRGEAFRLTTRLMQVVSWLLTQRALHSGELSAAEFSDDSQYRLGANKVCRDASQHHHPTIPPRLSDMLDRSLNLYTRIERLDEMMHGSIH